MTHPHAVRSLLFVNVCLAAAKGPCERPRDLGKAALPPAASGGQGMEAGMLLGSGCLPVTSVLLPLVPKMGFALTQSCYQRGPWVQHCHTKKSELVPPLIQKYWGTRSCVSQGPVEVTLLCAWHHSSLDLTHV